MHDVYNNFPTIMQMLLQSSNMNNEREEKSFHVPDITYIRKINVETLTVDVYI